MRRAVLRGVLLFLCVLSVSCAGAAPTGAPPSNAGATAAPDAAPPAWQAEWDRVVAEAKREGELIIWGNGGDDARRFEKEAFERAYPGIRVTHYGPASNSERDSRYLQEFQSGVAKLDVFVGGSAGVNSRIKPINGIQEIRPFLILPEITDPNTWQDHQLIWVDDEEKYMLQAAASPSTAVVLNKSVDANEVQSWWDLLKPQFKGKIVMLDPRQSGGGFSRALFFYYTPELGPAFTQRFYSETGVTFSADERQNLEWVTSGRMLVNINPSTFEVIEAEKLGIEFKVVSILKVSDTRMSDTATGSPGIAFVPNIELPHPNAAKVYLNWFYSKTGQSAMQEIRQAASLRADVPKDNIHPYLVTRPGVTYMVASKYTEANVVQEMRDDVNRWLPNP